MNAVDKAREAKDKGAHLLEKGKTEAALKEFQRAVELVPDDVAARKKVAELLSKLGKKDQAVVQYQHLAGRYAADGQLAQAIAVSKLILQLDPKHTQTQETLALPPSRGRALSLGLLNPSIPLKKLGFRLPASLKEMRIDLYLSSTGTTTVRIAFEDESEEAAADHALTVSRQLEDFLWRVTQLNELTRVLAPRVGRGGAGLPFDMPPLAIVADKARILGGMDLPETATRHLLSKIVLLSCPPPSAKRIETEAVASAPVPVVSAPAPVTSR